jgi:alpha-tubulin suppressor-like RCC1 family protein
MATQIIQGVQYSGIWTMQQVNAAIAAGTWPVPNSTLFAWGYGGAGSLGLSNTTNYSSPKQVANSNWKNVSITAFFTVASKQDGSLWSWGANSYGQLGTGNTTYYSSPKQVGSLTSWLSVAACQYHSLAVKTDGTLWSWGSNSSGQLGLGNTTNYSSPKQIGALTTWSKVYRIQQQLCNQD